MINADVASVAISGIKAAIQKQQATSHNLANIGTISAVPDPDDPASLADVFTPVDVLQKSAAGGGTYNDIRGRDPAGFLSYSPENPLANEDGMVLRPNVDLAVELTNLIETQRSFEVNILSIKTYDEMMQSILDLKA